MNTLTRLLSGVALATAVSVPLQSASAWGGPWGPPGAWGAPGPMVPPGVAQLPGWSPEEVAQKYDFYGPYGPSISDIRRFHRDMAWGRPLDSLYSSPLGPSPSAVRRQERQESLRQFGAPY